MVFVFINPSAMEYYYCGNFGSERQADKFIEEQVAKSKGYYTTSSYTKTKKIG